MGVIIAIVFILNNDWNIQSSDFGVIKRAGEWIMANRPSFGRISILPNLTGGLLAILAPITFALGFHRFKNGGISKAILPLGMGILVLVGLFLTSSRGAWIALILGMGAWALWRVSGYLSVKTKWPQQMVFTLTLLIILIPSVWLIMTYPGGVVGFAGRLPGSASGESRLDLALNTSKLIGDFPFTGGGLGSFLLVYIPNTSWLRHISCFHTVTIFIWT